MKSSITFLFGLFLCVYIYAENPVGKWKKISEISVYAGQTFDSHKALLSQKPCAAKIVYEINADATFRLNASASGCDESYKKIQEKLYSKTKWNVQGNKITISTLSDFSVGQTYIISYSGNKMIWKGTDGQGTITYQKL
ncbi:MAG TPA: lipocalin family protein [Chitinophagales bacterium]|jgi:hypothetical protein|nr:lipocalin family protein [Chitinophagales bacterium]HQG37782.1 lipocalin family protein [Chitinophagales bacterium]